MTNFGKKVDVLIIGSEGAGAYAAIKAQDRGANVLVLTKGRFGGSGSTLTGLADIDLDSQACCELGFKGNPDDSEEIFFEDMLIEGRYINNQALVDVHVRDAVSRVRELVEWGMRLTDILHTPGHRYPRGLLCSGTEIMRRLRTQVIRRKIPLAEHIMVTDLLTRDGRVIGAVGLDLVKGEFISIQAKATIMATGGAMAIYPIYTAPEELTGDGRAMSLRAGVEFIDTEMTQFHPCNLLFRPCGGGSGSPSPSARRAGCACTSSTSGASGSWPNGTPREWNSIRGRSFDRHHEGGAGGPRLAGRRRLHVLQPPPHEPDRLLRGMVRRRVPSAQGLEYEGFDFKELVEKMKNGYALECGPASHFFMGGIRINPDCETNLPGLYAAGEVAGGLHGANRLSGNALTQVFVQGAVSGESATMFAGKTDWVELDAKQIEAHRERLEAPLRREDGIDAWELIDHLRKLAWEKVGVIRSGEGLAEALEEFKRIRKEELPRLHSKSKERKYNKEWIECLQVQSILDTIEAIAVSALHRKESRGAHYRTDASESDDAWLKNISLRRDESGIALQEHPLVITRIQPELKPTEEELEHVRSA